MEQVAITGVGVISALGSGGDSFTEGLDTGRWVVEPAPWADPPSGRHAWISPVSSFDPARWIDERVRSGTDLFAQYALAAAAQAVQDHGADLEPERTGVVIGTTMAGAGSLVEAQRLLDPKGPQAVPRKLNIQAWPNMAAGQIALRWRLHGPLLTVSTACASGLDAIGTAAEMIESGRADVVIAGGTERGLSEVLYHSQTAYGMSGAVSDPALATMPFDRRRSGLVEGEGGQYRVALPGAGHRVVGDGGAPVAEQGDLGGGEQACEGDGLDERDQFAEEQRDGRRAGHPSDRGHQRPPGRAGLHRPARGVRFFGGRAAHSGDILPTCTVR